MEDSISFKARLTTIQQYGRQMFEILTQKRGQMTVSKSVYVWHAVVCEEAFCAHENNKGHLSHFYHSFPNYLFTYADKVIMNDVKLKPLKNSQNGRQIERERVRWRWEDGGESNAQQEWR